MIDNIGAVGIGPYGEALGYMDNGCSAPIPTYDNIGADDADMENGYSAPIRA